jgi:hypothetical protein
MQTIEEIKAAIYAKEKERQIAVEAYSAELRTLKTQLIAAAEKASGLKQGDRVMIVKRTPEYGIFDGYQARYGNELHPVIYKIKKDGTASKFELYAYGAKIEKA